ncbi:MAG: heavy metal translocating P-type ATPase [Planctomycetes bacterium]|nr:heavy metal translocating P-type ATPase [Planctomycetota bacterium]
MTVDQPGRKYIGVAVLALAMIAVHLVLRFATSASATWVDLPLWMALLAGGAPILWDLAVKIRALDFGADLLAGISIVSAAMLGEHLAGALVVLMFSGGESLESYAVYNASSVLAALARRMPSHAHCRRGEAIAEVPVAEVAVGDLVVIFPHEACPADGIVVEGHGTMDESYLTGEPYQMSKVPGAEVLSGSINGASALTIRTTRLAVDSRYARIMHVMQATAQHQPRMRRLGDQLGTWYTPLALAWAAVAWLASGEANRFLAVLVVATPCPLLIAIPVAILGGISLSARRGIIIKNPAAFEQLGQCRTVIFDKTGTLTYGQPRLTEQLCQPGFEPRQVLALAASLEQYSKHPLSGAILAAADNAHLPRHPVAEISEPPGRGLTGTIAGQRVEITSRKHFLANRNDQTPTEPLPPQIAGMECLVLVDGRLAAAYRFRDEPRADGASFIHHLAPKHGMTRTMIVSGDRDSEVRYLAERVGIDHVFSSQSPEDKVAIVRRETAQAKTLFLGDGINDAPALVAATVGIAFGQSNEVTSAAADAVVLDSSLSRVDELLHIAERMRRIALQSAVGGMALSTIGMGLAAAGVLAPVAGAVFQELIDVWAVLNALRAGWSPRALIDFE